SASNFLINWERSICLANCSSSGFQSAGDLWIAGTGIACPGAQEKEESGAAVRSRGAKARPATVGLQGAGRPAPCWPRPGKPDREEGKFCRDRSAMAIISVKSQEKHGRETLE
ncbi:MAG: hypothetical protein ACO1N5_11625, partial [Noviherbaspirillum sp.]